MSPSLTTTYLGHRERGYLAQVVEPASGKCLIATAFRALEDAFEIIEETKADAGAIED